MFNHVNFPVRGLVLDCLLTCLLQYVLRGCQTLHTVQTLFLLSQMALPCEGPHNNCRAVIVPLWTYHNRASLDCKSCITHKL